MQNYVFLFARYPDTDLKRHGPVTFVHVVRLTAGWIEGSADFCWLSIQFSFEILNRLFPFKDII